MSFTKNPPAFVYAPAVDFDGEAGMIEVSAATPLYVTLVEYTELDEKATHLKVRLTSRDAEVANLKQENYQLLQRENAIKTLLRTHLTVWPGVSISGDLAKSVLAMLTLDDTKSGDDDEGFDNNEEVAEVQTSQPTFTMSQQGFAQATGARIFRDNGDTDLG